ncbi:MAG: hypothetical protein LBC23_04030 [Coriobacteriales bacterium]|nr:hypothetical protein [Coriobacteriales bacterium]
MSGVLAAIVFCVAIPFVIMAMLAPSLKASAPKTRNFRGVLVYNGLGIVWFVWLISFWVGAHLLATLHIDQPAWIRYLVPLFPVLAGSCAFGLFDDWAGSNLTRGFGGHLKALMRGRLTTGGLKFLGIGFLSLFLAISLYYTGAASIPRVLLVTCAIALTANLMNLFDLRPGRAQKIYLLGLALALCLIAAFGVVQLKGFDLVALALVGLGPLLAVWRFDLGEQGMIGDAGANSMGAFLGFLYATALPEWALAFVVLVLVAVNLLSERVSFSKIIEGNRVLARLDAWGRKKDALHALDAEAAVFAAEDSRAERGNDNRTAGNSNEAAGNDDKETAEDGKKVAEDDNNSSKGDSETNGNTRGDGVETEVGE